MPRARAGITKDKNGTWFIHTRFSVNGKVKEVFLRGFKTESEAYAEKVRLQNMYKQIGINNNIPLTFSELANQYYEKYRLTVKPTTASNRYSSFAKYFIEPNKEKSILQIINPLYASEFKQELLSLKITSDWINKLIKYFNNILDYAYDNAYITADDFKNTKRELTKVYTDPSFAKEKEIWTKEEFKQFLSTFDEFDKYYVLFKVFMHLGCRIGELRGIQVKHFNRFEKTIYICQQATSKIGGKVQITTLKTKSSIRYIDLSEEINNLLSNYIDSISLDNENYLFFGSNPINPISENSIRTKLFEHVKKAGIKYISPHGFRHSNTTWILSGDLTLNEIGQVSRRLGHSNKSITLNIYYHIHDERSKNILKNLD